MLTITIIFKKSPAVLSYFQDRSNFAAPSCSSLFADQEYYYAVCLDWLDNPANILTSIKEKLQKFIVRDNTILARGDIRELSTPGPFEYKLRIFPIRNLLSVKEFYLQITTEIAEFFLSLNNMYLDYDFINEETNQLFVFTKSDKMKPNAENTEDPRQRYPEFYARLDRLVTEDLDKPIILELIHLNDLQQLVHKPNSPSSRNRYSFLPSMLEHSAQTTFPPIPASKEIKL